MKLIRWVRHWYDMVRHESWETVRMNVRFGSTLPCLVGRHNPYPHLVKCNLGFDHRDGWVCFYCGKECDAP